MLWRIYYSDETTFDNAQGSPQDAPPWGVVVIVQLDPKTNIMLMQGWDYYYYHRQYNQWWGSNLIGMIDQFATFPDKVTALKIGRNVHTPLYDAIILSAQNDPDFPKRSNGKQRLEHDT